MAPAARPTTATRTSLQSLQVGTQGATKKERHPSLRTTPRPEQNRTLRNWELTVAIFCPRFVFVERYSKGNVILLNIYRSPGAIQERAHSAQARCRQEIKTITLQNLLVKLSSFELTRAGRAAALSGAVAEVGGRSQKKGGALRQARHGRTR